MSEGCAGGLSKTGFVPEALLRDERALPPRELINNSGEVVGLYRDSQVDYGFVYDKGTYTTINPPGATLTVLRSGTA